MYLGQDHRERAGPERKRCRIARREEFFNAASVKREPLIPAQAPLAMFRREKLECAEKGSRR
jgi:hypothetical protein